MNYLAPLPEDTRYIDLWEALEARHVEPPKVGFELAKYRQEEIELINPALREAGYQINGAWFDGERDSFGPLTRCVRTVNPYGERCVVVYG